VNLTASSLADTIQLDLETARLALAESQADQQRKDTPAARSRLAECRARVDRVLDSWNAARTRDEISA
jgi:hypothetical protein